MLLKIGMVECDLAFNIDRVARETTHDYAEKPVVGAMPPLEDVGLGPENLTVSGRLLPTKLGGLGTLELLRSAQRGGAPQFVIRGDGTVLGFYVVQAVSDEHSFLDCDGVGQVVDIAVKMRKAAAPSPADFFSNLFGLF
jgi:phage protein U